MGKAKYYEDDRNEMDYFVNWAPKRCIEFGCSSGRFSEKIKKKYNTETWGVDIDEKSISKAKKRLDNVLLGDAMQLIDELPKGYFDCLICNDIIEHLPYPELFFEKISSRLTPDAFLICSLPNVRYWRHFNKYFFLKDWKYKQSGILDYTHLRFFTIKSMKRSIKSWGYDIEMMKGIRPTKDIFFYIFDLLTLFFIHDMRYLQFGFKAKLKK